MYVYMYHFPKFFLMMFNQYRSFWGVTQWLSNKMWGKYPESTACCI